VSNAVLLGCAEKPGAPVQHTRLFATDLAGAAKNCTASKPDLAAGKESAVAMQVGNDGGWCAVTVQQSGKPYEAGLLTTLAAHGTVFIHPVGDDTRIDYTPAHGFHGTDSFVVSLIPGDPTIRAEVTVTP
jgi:hypothetical protein